MRPIAVFACLPLLVLPASRVLAHTVDSAPTWATAFSLEPWLIVPLLLGVLGYAAGLHRIWRRVGVGHGVGRAQAGFFFAGIGLLTMATVWPLDVYGSWSLAAHVAQHMLLLAVVPPLLVLGRPMAAAAVLLPVSWSRSLRPGHRWSRQATANLIAATAVHCAVMWLWHLPAATSAALASDGLHWLMHGSFLGAGLWFWSAILKRSGDTHTDVVPALVALVAVMMQMGLLGALLCFAQRPLYPDYVERAPQVGLSALADQQLAGLVMWVPACLPYLLIGLWLMSRMLSAGERHPVPSAGQSKTPR